MLESKNLAFDLNYQMIILMAYDFASLNVGTSIQRGDQNSLMFAKCSILQKQQAWRYWMWRLSIFCLCQARLEVDASWMSGEKAPSLAFHFSLGILVP
jgi:hypothetical protein